MTMQQLIERARKALTDAEAQRAAHRTEQENILATVEAEHRGELTEAEQARFDELSGLKRTLDTDTIPALRTKVDTLLAEERSDAEFAARSQESHPAGADRRKYDEVARVGGEKRTYRPDEDPKGTQFLSDVAARFFGDVAASERLAHHDREERVEHPQFFQRAAGTGAFSGLVVPQYLTDLYAPAAAASRPFADACNKHDLPAQGMTVNISRITTATSAALQSSENSAVSETNIDDTLLTLNVQTIAAQQTLSRQAIDRGAGVEDVTLDDLTRRYSTVLDSTLINQATTGLSAVATSIAYTDASPTVAELYPNFAQALSAVEAAMLDQASGENIAVMHSRRWYWLQQALSSSWPLMGQPNVAPQMWGDNYGKKYGSGVRGILPNGTPVIVDNNVPTNLGGGTNQDEIYVADSRECHLWEDPNAPLFIRADQPAVASLGVLLVIYGYIAYTFSRYSHAQKLGGTGLVTPTWTGV